MVIGRFVMDYRLELLKEYRELLLNWDNNNMLYNSLKFYKIYNGDVEHSELVSTLLCRETGKKNDIMTSWWKPTKYFLFRSININQLIMVHKETIQRFLPFYRLQCF